LANHQNFKTVQQTLQLTDSRRFSPLQDAVWIKLNRLNEFRSLSRASSSNLFSVSCPLRHCPISQ
jgi:hypothetical protein